MPTYQQLFKDAERQQAYADALAGRSLQSRTPQSQGRIVPQMGYGEGLAQLGEALFAKRAGKRADMTLEEAEALKRQMQAEAIKGLSSQNDPYAAAQGALNADINPGIVSAAMSANAPGTPIKVDAGDAWVFIDSKTRQEVGRIPKSADPNAVLNANVEVRGQDLGQESALRGQDLSSETARRGQDIGAETSRRGQDLNAELDIIRANSASDKEAQSKIDGWNVYSTGMQQLVSALENTSTGPGIGILPALSANSQIAENSIASMVPLLKQLFRVSGEGIFTDKDQALLLKMVPDRNMSAEARGEAISNINNIVMTKLGLDPSVVGNVPAGSQPESQEPAFVSDFLSELTPEQRKKYGF